MSSSTSTCLYRFSSLWRQAVVKVNATSTLAKLVASGRDW